jgi:proton-coupled amino acid transporter
MMGFAFFMFEGIGCMMPIMKETAVPEKFPYIVTVCLIFLCTTYICFSALCYYTWGSDLDETVVTEMLPADNKFVQLMKLLFCINLVFSYPMTNAITHTVAQEFVFGTSYGGRADRPDEKVHYWKVNILRSLILCFSLCVTVCVADQLDHVLAIAGAILGMTNVLLIPSICHYKLLAETRA